MVEIYLILFFITVNYVVIPKQIKQNLSCNDQRKCDKWIAKISFFIIILHNSASISPFPKLPEQLFLWLSASISDEH